MARTGAQAAAEDAASLTMIDIPRGKYIGRRVGGSPKDEAAHFYQCEACGGWVGRRDLAKDRCRIRRRISRNDHGCRRPNRRIVNASGLMPPPRPLPARPACVGALGGGWHAQLKILDDIAKRGAGFKSLHDAWADTTSAHGRLMVTVLAGLAEHEIRLAKKSDR
jgi:resolvase-like protein